MQQVVLSTDESFVLSAQVALDAHGIRHYDQRLVGAWKPSAVPNCIMVDDADFERAKALVGTLQETIGDDGLSGNRRYRLVAAVAVIGMVVLVLAFLFMGGRP